MKLLYIEPYYGDSHKNWIKQFKKYSSHDIDIIKLPGNKWKWRMHGGAITLANKFLELNEKIDLILCSDFLNLPVFKSICNQKSKNIPIVMYFHENQLSYPWSPEDKDINLKRDLHYHYINYTSSLISDFNLFNSNYHLDSYINSIHKYLKKMPDFNNFESVKEISEKSSVLYIGCELEKFNRHKVNRNKNKSLILWNHRWEFDKNPEVFFQTLFKLKDKGYEFELAVLGEKFKQYPAIFDEAKSYLSENIVHFGYCNNFEEYAKWLWKADLLPITSNQDFFGISIVEAVYCNTIPILPTRLSYTELFDIDNNPNIFYKKDNELYEKIKFFLKNPLKISFKHIEKFDWNSISNNYDSLFEKLKFK